MFLGQHERQIERGKVLLPAAFAAHLDSRSVLTRGFDRNLLVFPAAHWQSLAARLAGLAVTKADARQLRRHLFAGAQPLSLDAAGWMALPSELADYGALEETAVLVGVYDYAEIWSPDRWSTAQEQIAGADPDRYQLLGI